MKAITLTNPQRLPTPEEGPPLAAFSTELKDRFEKGEKLYIRFVDGTRSGSIGYIKYIKKFDNSNAHRRWAMQFTTTIVWDDRKNSATAHLFSSDRGCTFELLEGYEGPTVWKQTDVDKISAKFLEDNPPVDIRGRVIKVGDCVVFTDTCGYTATLSYGAIHKIATNTSFPNDGKPYTEISIIINDVRRETEYKIKSYKNTMLIINETDLIPDMLLMKFGL